MSYAFDTYQNQAGMVRLPTANTTYLFHGLPGEVGELCSLVAKGLRDGRQFDHDQNVKKELGDILWNVAAVAARLATAIVETTAEVEDGTVYRVVLVVADGALCPKTLYTVGT